MRPSVLANSEQIKQIANDLTAFVHRVALDKKASPAEISVLPEIAKVLCEMSTINKD